MTLISCGGGGDGSPVLNTGGTGTPTDSNLNFQIFPANYFVDYNVSVNLSGSDNQGNTYTGDSSDKTLPAVMFLGENSIPIQSIINFTISNGGSGSAIENQHFGTVVNDRRYLGVDIDVVTVSATTTTIPPAAKIGDSGTVGTYIDNKAFVSIITWRLEDGLNGNAKLIIFNTTNNASDILDNTFTTTYIINPDGTRVSVEYKTFNDNVNLEVILSGTY